MTSGAFRVADEDVLTMPLMKWGSSIRSAHTSYHSEDASSASDTAVIPPNIHFLWISPSPNDRNIPDDVQGNVQTWREFHPDYSVRVWSMDDVSEDLESYCGLPLLDLIKCCRFEAMKSDIIRLFLVHKYGGFYNDLKNRAMRPFLNDLSRTSKALVTEHAPTIENYKGRLMNSFLAGPPRHDFFLDCLREVASNVDQRREANVIDVTGASVFAAAIRSRSAGGISDVVVLDSEAAWGLPYGQGDSWMKRTSASYNGRDLKEHWSRRQATESLYVC